MSFAGVVFYMGVFPSSGQQTSGEGLGWGFLDMEEALLSYSPFLLPLRTRCQELLQPSCGHEEQV